MFVGETGVMRVVERTADVMRETGKDHPDDLRQLGVIDLPTIQRYLNLWYTVSLDLFGGEVSSNAASFFATGLKGRAREAEHADHLALEGTYALDRARDGALVREDVPLRNAMNEVLRDAYVEDSQRGVDRWNKAIAERGISFQLRLPNRRFHRAIGVHAGVLFDPDGRLVDEAAWRAGEGNWLPTASDRAFVQGLMTRPVLDPRQMASWLASPRQGIKGRPVDFEYVRHGVS